MGFSREGEENSRAGRSSTCRRLRFKFQGSTIMVRYIYISKMRYLFLISGEVCRRWITVSEINCSLLRASTLHNSFKCFIRDFGRGIFLSSINLTLKHYLQRYPYLCLSLNILKFHFVTTRRELAKFLRLSFAVSVKRTRLRC